MNSLPFSWHGPSDAPLLVLGNSLGTTQAMWDPLRAALGDTFRIFTFDLPGHAAVETDEFSFNDIVERSAETLDSAGVVNATFCGVSLGGALGVAIAARYPAMVTRLVIINAPIRQSSAQFWIDRAEIADRDGLGSFSSTLADRWFGPASDPALVERVVADFGMIPPRGYAQACRALAALDITADAARVGAPTLVVRGADDVAVPAENALELAATIAGAEMRTLEGAAHLLPVDHARELATLVTEMSGATS